MRKVDWKCQNLNKSIKISAGCSSANYNLPTKEKKRDVSKGQTTIYTIVSQIH